MKGKEEDEERNENICPQADNQAKSNSITEATLILCGSSGERANKIICKWYHCLPGGQTWN